MDHSREFRLVLEAIRDQRLDPSLAAQLATEWSPTLNLSFPGFLAAKGVLAADPTEAESTLGDGSTRLNGFIPANPGSTVSFDGEAATEVGLACRNGSSAGASIRWPVLPSGRYVPIRLHRTGGLGQVWLARDTVLDREVALKVIRPDRAEVVGYVARFVQEARVTGQLEHPGIVPLYDLIEPDAERGTGPGYVMRFIPEGTLAESIAAYHARRKNGEDGPLELRNLLDAFIAVCQAVAYAHSRGVLHRDLKGQNVVLGDFGEVFLLDWGLTKEIPDLPVSAPGLANGEHNPDTRPSGIVGTPAYMAPEVAAGNPSTKVSDIYGLGAILYSILTGKPPMDGPTPEAILHKVRSSDPAQPRAVNPATSITLAAVCKKAMAREPSDRYESAELLAADVRRWLADEPVTACPDPWLTRAGRWARKHRTSVAAAVMMLITAVFSLSIGSFLLFREQQKTRAEWLRAEKNLDAAHELTMRMIDITERVLPPIPRSELARRDLAHAASEIAHAFSEQRPDSSDVRRWNAQLNRYEANLLRLLDETTSAEAAYQAALKGLRVDTRNPDRLAETLRDYAGLQARTGRLKEALASLEEAQVLARGIRKVDPGRIAFRRIDASINLDRASVEESLGMHEAASRSADRAIEILGKLVEIKTDEAHPYDPLLLADSLLAKAVSERERAGYDAASPLIKDARGRARTLIDGKSFGGILDDALFTQALIEYESSRTWVGNTRIDLKKDAEVNLRLVLVRLEDLTTRHPDIPLYRGWLARARVTRGEIQESQGRLDDARRDFEKAIEEVDRLAREYPRIPMHRANQGRASLGLGRIARANHGDPAAVKSWRIKGIEALQSALDGAPDDVEIRKWLSDARADERAQ